MKKILVVVILLTALFYYLKPDKYKLSQLEIIENEIIAEHASNQREKGFSIHSFGSGSGKTLGKKIDMLSFEVITKKTLTIEEGRRLCVKSIKDFLAIINQEKYKDYLYEPPFTIDDISYAVSAGDSFVQPEKFLKSNIDEISRVSLIIEKLWYDGKKRIEGIHSETFEEAERIVNEAKNIPVTSHNDQVNLNN